MGVISKEQASPMRHCDEVRLTFCCTEEESETDDLPIDKAASIGSATQTDDAKPDELATATALNKRLHVSSARWSSDTVYVERLSLSQKENRRIQDRL